MAERSIFPGISAMAAAAAAIRLRPFPDPAFAAAVFVALLSRLTIPAKAPAAGRLASPGDSPHG